MKDPFDAFTQPRQKHRGRHKGIEAAQHDAGRPEGIGVAVGLGEVFGDGLTENERGEGHDDRGHNGALGSHDGHHQHRGHGRGDDMDDVDGDQQGDHRLVKPVKQKDHSFCPFVPAFRQQADADLVAVGKRRFTSREETANENKSNEQQTSRYTVL